MAKKSKKTPKETPGSTEAPKRGRPKGSGNIERPTATAVSARCPRCRSTRYTHQPGSRPIVRRLPGMSRITAEPYEYVVWRKVVCECGQHFRIREETNHDPRDETPLADEAQEAGKK